MLRPVAVKAGLENIHPWHTCLRRLDYGPYDFTRSFIGSEEIILIHCVWFSSSAIIIPWVSEFTVRYNFHGKLRRAFESECFLKKAEYQVVSSAFSNHREQGSNFTRGYWEGSCFRRVYQEGYAYLPSPWFFHPQRQSRWSAPINHGRDACPLLARKIPPSTTCLSSDASLIFHIKPLKEYCFQHIICIAWHHHVKCYV